MADLQKKWWKAEKDQAHQDIFDEVDRLEARNQNNERRWLEYYRSYTGREVDGLRPGELVWETEGDDERPPLNYNLTSSAVDTAHSRHCVHRIRIQVVTQGGNWSQAQRARLMQRFIDGLMMAVDGHTQLEHQFIDGAIFGSGFVRVSEDGDPISIEWQFAPEFLVDEQACVGGVPRNVYQRKWLSAETIIEKWDIKDDAAKDRIVKAAMPIGGGNVTESLVKLVIATRRSVKPGMEKPDGRRVICCKGVTLSDEPWPDDDFDFVKWDWKRAPGFYFGIGAAEELRSFQSEIKEALGKNQRAMHFGSKLIVLKPVGSEVPDAHVLTEEDCIEIPYAGPTPPSFTVPDPVSPQQMQYPFVLATQGYNQIGVSQMEAQAERPDGNMSGRALRTIKEIATGRGAMRDRSREKAHERVVNLSMRLIREKAKRASKEGKDISVLYKNGRSFERINWKDVELPEEDYHIQCFPTAWLPLEPGARMQTIQDWISMGWLDPDLGAQLMDMPDIDRVQSIRLAALNHIQWMLDKILYDGEAMAPDEVMDLDLGITWARSTYLWAQMHGAPEDRLRAVIEWIEAAKNLKRANSLRLAEEQSEMQRELQAQAAKLGMGAGGTPGGAGLMAPTGQNPGGAPVLPAGPGPMARPAMSPLSPVPGPAAGVMPDAG